MNEPFSDFQPLTVMLSSRCHDLFEFQGEPRPMSDLRRAIKTDLEKIRFGGKAVFQVWIHEEEFAGAAISWDTCIAKARQADIFLVLYNGNSGWSGSTDETLKNNVGICHAEFNAALTKSREKVRSIHLLPGLEDPENGPHTRFREEFLGSGVMGAQVTNGEDAVRRAKEIAVATMLTLARSGVGVSSRGSGYSGQALDWNRMDYRTRRDAATRTLVNFLKARAAPGKASGHDRLVILDVLPDQPVAFLCDCIPASLTTASARELVGQPFLTDHLTVSGLPEEVAGPVHLIACHKGISQSQAMRQLGFPDAVIVPAPFGVYVADPVQKIQMVFLAHCQHETSTELQVQDFLSWLRREKEDRNLTARAISRRKLADLTAKECDVSP